MDSIRLLLVDDHDVVRTGMKSFLEDQEEFKVIAEADTGREAVSRALEHKPDVVVMDISMPEMDGMEATRQIIERWPECRILALTVHEDKEYLFEMITAGASGYLTKRVVADELVFAVRAVHKGNVYLQPALARWLLEDYRNLRSDRKLKNRVSEYSDRVGMREKFGELTAREVEVLDLVAEGLTSSEIAEVLEISPRTVSRHRERIMNRLDIHSATALVKYGIQAGVITMD